VASASVLPVPVGCCGVGCSSTTSLTVSFDVASECFASRICEGYFDSASSSLFCMSLLFMSVLYWHNDEGCLFSDPRACDVE